MSTPVLKFNDCALQISRSYKDFHRTVEFHAVVEGSDREYRAYWLQDAVHTAFILGAMHSQLIRVLLRILRIRFRSENASLDLPPGLYGDSRVAPATF